VEKAIMKDENKKLEGLNMRDENTDLRERTKDFAIRVIRMYSTLPKSAEAQILGKQVLRSTTSIGDNYREAFRPR
jgi:hypothetical protein